MADAHELRGAPLRTLEQLVGDLLGDGNGTETSWDAFLSATAVAQALEDHLRREVPGIDRVARRVGEVGRVGASVASLSRAVGDVVFSLRRWWPSNRRLERHRMQCAELVGQLADDVARGEDRPPRPLSGRARITLTELAGSRLRHELARRPACFADFDQQLEDLRALAQRALSQGRGTPAPVLVVGLRTSGSYLAPLSASLLRSMVDRSVDWMTLRPSQRLGAGEKRTIAEHARAGSQVLVVDDPPRTGAQAVQCAEVLEALGVGRDRITPTLALFPDADGAQKRLAPYRPVVLSWPEWEICRRLEAPQLMRTLDRILPGQSLSRNGGRIGAVRSIDSVEVRAPRRGHISATVALTVTLEDGTASPLRIFADGIGQGYFADHALSLAARLREFVPLVFGADGGLLFREWIEESSRATIALGQGGGQDLVATVARYLAARTQRLGLPEDPSLRRPGEAVWEEVGVMLARVFPAPGAGYLVARPLARRTARRLLDVRAPTVIDGAMRLSDWFIDGSKLVKTRVWRGVYSEKRQYSADFALDLAVAAAELERAGEPRLSAKLRARTERETGILIDEQRWLLYRLLDHLTAYEHRLRVAASSDHQPAAFEEALALERLMARTYRGYIDRCLLSDLEPNRGGPICAIDIDGVLEARWLGFPATAPAAAQALRALNGHGCRVVLATGRSLSEVRERCAAYHLTGGVAEYGAAIYDHLRGCERSLLTDGDVEQLDAVRVWLRARPRVYLDPEHLCAVRAHMIDSSGNRRGLPVGEIEKALEMVPSGSVRAVRGDLQTDFVPTGVDKGVGLRALAQGLDAIAVADRPVAFAIGDTEADLPMFAVAEQPFAPSDATPPAAAAGRVAGQPGGSGLLDAVETFLGHRVEGCEICHAALPQQPEPALLLDWLAVLGGGRSVKARVLASTARRLARRHP